MNNLLMQHLSTLGPAFDCILCVQLLTNSHKLGGGQKKGILRLAAIANMVNIAVSALINNNDNSFNIVLQDKVSLLNRLVQGRAVYPSFLQ